MNKAKLRAAAATILFASTLGVLIAVTVFGVARIGDQALESISVLPLNWGQSHIKILMEIAVGASLPMMAWFTIWFFKKAQDAETKLAGYRYTPPEK